MPTAKDGLKDRLARYRQIRLSVIGRKSGKTISPASVFHLRTIANSLTDLFRADDGQPFPNPVGEEQPTIQELTSSSAASSKLTNRPILSGCTIGTVFEVKKENSG